MAISWRRFFQGHLIHGGLSGSVGRASVGRIAVVIAVLAVGLRMKMSGFLLAGIALIAGVFTEAFWVMVAAWRSGVTRPPTIESSPGLPTDLRGVWKFYWPLANSMLVVWGGRALLMGIVARASDGPVALAAWVAAWGFILVIANATRMVQQVVICNHWDDDRVLLNFALAIGAACSLFLLMVAITPVGAAVIAAFVGQDPVLIGGVRPAILLGSGIPILVSLQNALQGFLIREGRTQRINAATWLGTSMLLSGAVLAVRAGLPGATAAGGAMLLALLAEAGWLGLGSIDDGCRCLGSP